MQNGGPMSRILEWWRRRRGPKPVPGRISGTYGDTTYLDWPTLDGVPVQVALDHANEVAGTEAWIDFTSANAPTEPR